MALKKIFSVIAPLFIGIVVFPVVYSWDSADVRSWWPWFAYLGTLLILAYTWVFFLIEKIRATSPRYIVLYSIFVASTYIGLSVLSVSPQNSIDWLALHEGRVELSLWQKLINSDYIHLWLALLFLCIHIGVVVCKKKLYSKTKETTLEQEQTDALAKNFGYYSFLLIILSAFAFVVAFS